MDPKIGAKLIDATKKGDNGQVSRILSKTPGIGFFRDGRGYTALHYAAEKGMNHCAELLVAADPRLVDVPENSGLTPMHLAAASGKVRLFEILYRGARPNLMLRAANGSTVFDIISRSPAAPKLLSITGPAPVSAGIVPMPGAPPPMAVHHGGSGPLMHGAPVPFAQTYGPGPMAAPAMETAPSVGTTPGAYYVQAPAFSASAGSGSSSELSVLLHQKTQEVEMLRKRIQELASNHSASSELMLLRQQNEQLRVENEELKRALGGNMTFGTAQAGATGMTAAAATAAAATAWAVHEKNPAADEMTASSSSSAAGWSLEPAAVGVSHQYAAIAGVNSSMWQAEHTSEVAGNGGGGGADLVSFGSREEAHESADASGGAGGAPAVAETCVAKYGYTCQRAGIELGFGAGEVLTVIYKQPDGWWYTRNALGQQGLVPSNYMQISV